MKERYNGTYTTVHIHRYTRAIQYPWPIGLWTYRPKPCSPPALSLEREPAPRIHIRPDSLVSFDRNYASLVSKSCCINEQRCITVVLTSNIPPSHWSHGCEASNHWLTNNSNGGRLSDVWDSLYTYRTKRPRSISMVSSNIDDGTLIKGFRRNEHIFPSGTNFQRRKILMKSGPSLCLYLPHPFHRMMRS